MVTFSTNVAHYSLYLHIISKVNLVTETCCDYGISMVVENSKPYMINFKSTLNHATEK